MQQNHTTCGTRALGGRAPHRRSSAGGFSLVEVLVALVLLTVGIFALIQLFPPGFFTLQVAANSTAADHLGQGELDRLAANNINQLEGIYALYQDPTSGDYSYNPLDTPDQHLRDTSLSYTSDIDAERAVQGEQVRIAPAVSVTPSGGGNPVQLSIYVPNFAPVYMPTGFVGYQTDKTTGNLTGTTSAELANDNYVFKVGGLPWTRIVGDSNSGHNDYADPDAEPQNGAPQYLIDYNAGEIALGKATFVEPVNFIVRDSTGTLYEAQFVWTPNTAPYQDVTLHNALWFTPSSWTNLSGTGGTVPVAPWQAGSDDLWRDFHIVWNANVSGDLDTHLQGLNQTFTQAFGADPYSYAIAYAGLSATSNMGVIAFNPTAAQIKDANGNPLMASISYSTMDWHIIHEDRTLGTANQTAASTPNTQFVTARLSLNHIYELGDSLSDNTIYPGIVQDMSNPLDVDVLDLQTGQTLAPEIVDYNNGVVTFDQTLSGHNVRIFYRAQNDWGLALIKAPEVYQTVLLTGSTPPSTYAPPTPNTPPTCYIQNSGTLLYFPATDVGKMVQITNVTGSNGVLYTDAHVRQIQPSSATTTVVQNGQIVAVPAYGQVNLSYDPNDPSNPDGDKGVLLSGVNISTTVAQPVQSIVGSSVNARVIWRERNTWRVRDVTTVAGAEV